MIKVHYYYIQNFNDSNWNDYLKHMPLSIRNMLSKYQNREDQIRGLVGKLLLRNLCVVEGYPVNVLETIQFDINNRPFFDTVADFNISHSGNYVVCAFSKTHRIGIDIEEIGVEDIGPLIDDLSPNEKIHISTSVNSSAEFYSLWTKKEAIVKANGKGLFIPLSEIILFDKKAVCENVEWVLENIQINEKYKCHLAFQSNSISIPEIIVTSIEINKKI